MKAGFPNPKLSAIGGWCLTLDECIVALAHHGVTKDWKRHHLVRQEQLRVVYTRILGKGYEVEHCLTAPAYMGAGACVEYIVFPVTAGYIETQRVQYTADGLEIDGLRQPDAETLAKLKRLLDVVGTEDDLDISKFAARIAALPLQVTESDCETILSNLSEALNVARKDIAFRLFHETDEMEAWESYLHDTGGDGMPEEYYGAGDSQHARSPDEGAKAGDAGAASGM